jgi:isoleucyl-tRNA synthetase
LSWGILDSGRDHCPSRVADLYLEGLDQFSGWFYSSLMMSVALQDGESPYRALFVHGFTVDSDGKKMSKSLGNVVDPEAITEGKGRGFKRKYNTHTYTYTFYLTYTHLNAAFYRKKGNKESSKVYGVDGLRLWVCAHASQAASIPASESIFETTKQDLDRIRLIFR